MKIPTRAKLKIVEVINSFYFISEGVNIMGENAEPQ